MKATGIVRRLDDLGRIVIPKEIRRTLRLADGDPMELYIGEDNEIVFKRYRPLEDLRKDLVQAMLDALKKREITEIAVYDRYGLIANSCKARKPDLTTPSGAALFECVTGISRMTVGEDLWIHPIRANGETVGYVTGSGIDALADGDTVQIAEIKTAIQMLEELLSDG